MTEITPTLYNARGSFSAGATPAAYRLHLQGAQTGAVRGSVGRNLGWPFWLLLVFSFVLPLSPQSFIGALRPLHLAFAAAGLAALTYGFDRYARRQPLLPMTRTTVLTLCLVGLAVVTLPLS